MKTTTAGGGIVDMVSLLDGDSAVYNISVPTLLKASPGRLVALSMINWGTASGSINDCASIGAAAPGNQIGLITTNQVAFTKFNWPCSQGIVIVPGTGQVVSVSFQ